ncbi:MAG: hypothetical protein ABGX05_03330 [Pirellulaceae bacterium]
MKKEKPEHQDKQELGFDEELVAYLDGELSRDNASRVEDALSENAEYRLRLKQLQQAWDLMDDLPQSTMDESFIKSTVELVVVSAESEVMVTVNRWKTWRIGIWAVSLAAVLVMVWGGSALVNSLGGRDNQQLLNDLPLVQEIDVYDPIDNMDFLKELDASGVFSEELDNAI